ncbi:hypothetical protein DDZ18_12580 [Marinicauda salina]|uniref:DUF2219 family protein n=1 Tax=Marinicauda salina TaxID=2135793 RepID=A0A2U2BRH6_9PROT|nr:hypothetical protein [Marinicauda salina]PWE16596.1 hypothetical protein DDZ18_12580 [Marinicauda salina]
MPNARPVVIVLACALGLASAGRAEAGAWVRKKGDGLLITTLSHHRLEAPSDGAALNKRELALYGEYGLTGRLTLVGRGALQDFRAPPAETAGPIETSVRTLGGSQAGLRMRLFEKGRWAGAAQALVTLESPGENRNNAELGQGGGDLDGRVMIGRAIGDRGFIEVQAGWRDPADEDAAAEVRLDVVAGLPVRERVRLVVQTFSVWSADSATASLPHYSGHRAQVSLMREFRGGRHVQLGVLSTVRADSMADEFAVMAGVWQEF